MDDNELDKKTIKPIVFTKPTTKLEHLEDTLINSNPNNNECTKQNSRHPLRKSFQSSSYVNTLNQNILPFTEHKKILLQRSISEKLRNSFKNRTSLLVNQNVQQQQQQQQQKPSLNLNTFKIEPRKWHSERYKKNSIITNHFLVNKAILVNYTPSKTVKPVTDLTPCDSSDSVTDDRQNCQSKNLEKQSSSDSDTESEEEIKKFLSNIKAIDDDSDWDDSELDETDLNFIYGTNSEPITILHEEFYDELNENEYSSEGNFYERVLQKRYECEICCELTHVNLRKCCNLKACNNCINMYIQSQIKECCGNVRIECLNDQCNKLIHRDEINERMAKFDKDSLNLYLKLLVDANKNSNCKTCPRCSHVMNLNSTTKKTTSSNTSTSRKSKRSSNLLTKCQCSECQLIWCFQCHAPWHDGITCNEFKKGDRMLKYWAKEVHYGQQNAQLCPKCNIYIQRTKGCDHMICPFCSSEFCYKCGKKFRSFRFIGDHYSKLSVLGCKYKFYPEKPTKRKLIRGSVLGAKIVATPFIAAVGLVVGVGVLAVGCVALPVYGSYKLAKHIKIRNIRTKKYHYDDDLSTGVDFVCKSSVINLNSLDQENKNCKESQVPKDPMIVNV